MRIFLCESCGAPLEAPWAELVIVCSYCGAQNFDGKVLEPVAPYVPVDKRPRLNLGGRSYVVEGPLGKGDSTQIYRARWAMRLGELVYLKLLTAQADADLMRNEWVALGTLRRSRAEGAEHFVTRLPAPVAHGLVTTDTSRLASVFGWLPGFSHTLSSVEQEHSEGVDGRIGVWMLTRLLELLGFVHRSGYVHGAVTPDHVLIHPRDHGATLIGWTLAQAHAGLPPLLGKPEKWRRLYGSAERAEPPLDIAMACRTVARVARFERPLQSILERGISGCADAWSLAEQLRESSRQVYGPPAYNPLALRGWR